MSVPSPLAKAAAILREAGMEFALVHEAALVAWDLAYEVFPRAMDVLLFSDADFDRLGVAIPQTLGTWSQVDDASPALRLWSRPSLGLVSPFEVVHALSLDCDVLAPELVLEKLPYSPDINFLREPRARLAEVVFFDRMGNDELALFHRYVRGD